MIRHIQCLAACGLAVLLPGQARIAEAQDQRAALLAADRATSQLSGDSGFASAAVSGLHGNAVLLWPGLPVVIGAQGLQRLFAGHLLDPLQLTWQPLAVELARDSSVGVTWGVAVAGARRSRGSPQIGRYVAAWRRDGARWTMAALVFTGIEPPESTLPPGIPLTRRAVEPRGAAAAFIAADLAFARLAADSGAGIAFERWAAPDAIVPGGRGLLTRGPEAIGRAVAGPAEWRWHPVAAGAAASGDLGWTVGEAVIAPEGEEPSRSKYLTIWIRRDGGDARFLVDGGNARPGNH